MKVVFFGDSVTEANRDHENPNDLGSGYVKFAEGKLRLLYPEKRITFLNRGVGGDGVANLIARFQTDVVAEQPDAVILQVGINDVWWRETSEEQFLKDYSALVASLKETGAKIIILQPFSLPVDDMGRLRPRLNAFNKIVGKVAKEQKLTLIPMDEIFTGASIDIRPTQFTVDGIHPTHRGHRYLADFVVKELKKYVV